MFQIGGSISYLEGHSRRIESPGSDCDHHKLSDGADGFPDIVRINHKVILGQ